ncbi:hypothetical protein [Gorillibacterium sp. sgz500922]|uniref:hypothetical protein n=1 Tax=Gorillibacterium sp. sgz500922 TaxID=3446694 RepID=UPI003F671D74
MNTLTRFELRKLIGRKTALAAMAALMVIITLVSFVPVLFESRTDENGTEVKRFAAIALDRRDARAWSGELTTDAIASALERYQSVRADKRNLVHSADGTFFTDKAYQKWIQPFDPVFGLMRVAYSGGDYDYFVLDGIQPKEAYAFYEKRMQKIHAYLNMDYTYGNYSEKDKAYYEKKNAEIRVPFRVGFSKGWEYLLENSEALLLLSAFLISICVAPVFSGEYQSGADAILLSTKYGRSRVIGAKLRASLLLATGLFLLAALLQLLLTFAIYGAEGGNLSLQAVSTRYLTAPFAFTAWGAWLRLELIGWLLTLMMAGVTLFLSARMSSPFPVIIGSTVLLFGSMLIPYSKDSRLVNHLIALLPGNHSNALGSITHYELYHLPWGVVPQHLMLGFTSLAVVCVTLPLAYRAFRRRQVV